MKKYMLIVALFFAAQITYAQYIDVEFPKIEIPSSQNSMDYIKLNLLQQLTKKGVPSPEVNITPIIQKGKKNTYYLEVRSRDIVIYTTTMR